MRKRVTRKRYGWSPDRQSSSVPLLERAEHPAIVQPISRVRRRRDEEVPSRTSAERRWAAVGGSSRRHGRYREGVAFCASSVGEMPKIQMWASLLS